MNTPTLKEFKSLSTQGNIIPIYKTLMADCLTPVLALERLGNSDYSFLLESVVGGEKIGRYSFLGANPAAVFKSLKDKITYTRFTENGENTSEETCEKPIDKLAELMAEYETVHTDDLPRFCGGGVGYLAYDVIRQVENLPNEPAKSLELPEIYFGFYHSMVIFDHVKRTMHIIAHADLREDDAETAYKKAEVEIEKIEKLLQAPGAIPVEEAPQMPDEDPEFTSNFKQEDYEKAVEACKEYIKAGDIFQVVISQRLEMKTKATPFEVYRTLRTINPSPYMLYLKYPELTVVGSSPEVMVRLEGEKITLRPIAGTRKRGKDEAEDAALAEDLLSDEKELAEHTMLLDLGRNDVGRVSEYGGVTVTEKYIIEKYSHVMHIVSNVEGKLKKGMTSFDTLKACLPAGTVSGAPKVRAMEIIDELEPDVRGVYAGAVGYVDFSGNMDTCIALRTAYMVNDTAYVQAGAGIVLDSVPETEYHETRSKARALLRAIKAAEGGK